ncbi:hypothetical protein LZ30DRAFT_770395 [Colletotrichum cereale]|nr:hypothetical protein LZ30DRAFT_770395 [Colletotrichum cereale]
MLILWSLCVSRFIKLAPLIYHRQVRSPYFCSLSMTELRYMKLLKRSASCLPARKIRPPLRASSSTEHSIMAKHTSTCDPIRQLSLKEIIPTGQFAIATRRQRTTTAIPKPVSAEHRVTRRECDGAVTAIDQKRSTHALADVSPYPRVLCQCRILVMHDPCDDTPFTVPLHAIGCPNRLQNVLKPEAGSTGWVHKYSKLGTKRVRRRTTVRKRHEWKSAKPFEEEKPLEQSLDSLRARG